MGCAGPRYQLVTGVDEMSRAERPVWPADGEVPRYMYAGALVGEQNLKVIEDDAQRSSVQKAVYWLVGLFEDREPDQMQSPQGGVVDENGVVYVTDVGSSSIFVFDKKLAERSGGRLPIWQQAAFRQPFVAPIAIALGANQEILVTDAELAQVFRLDRQGHPLGSFGEGHLKRPTGIARDPKLGRIYVADTQAHNIKVFNDQGILQRTIGLRGKKDGELNFPIHLHYANERLYVVDSMNARIQIFNKHGHHLQSFGERGKYIGQFSRPKGVTADSQGNIYVVDSYFDYMLVFNKRGDFLLPIGGTGESIGNFYLPAGVWSDDHDNIYVADMANGRVVIFQFLGGD
jgi:DNA-binding beta-propeller fold protein YncE